MQGVRKTRCYPLAAACRMLQVDEPEDFVLATGEMHSVREFVERAFSEIGRTIEWKGEGVDEIGVDAENGETLVSIDPRYFRPAEVEQLLGDPTKAQEKLGWKHKTTFPELVKMMVEADVKLVGEEEQNRKSRDA